MSVARFARVGRPCHYAENAAAIFGVRREAKRHAALDLARAQRLDSALTPPRVGYPERRRRCALPGKQYCRLRRALAGKHSKTRRQSRASEANTTRCEKAVRIGSSGRSRSVRRVAGRHRRVTFATSKPFFKHALNELKPLRIRADSRRLLRSAEVPGQAPRTCWLASLLCGPCVKQIAQRWNAGQFSIAVIVARLLRSAECSGSRPSSVRLGGL